MALDREEMYATLHPYFRERVRPDEPLAQHCAFGVGGTADICVTVEEQRELRDLISLCAARRWPLLVIGEGRNVLFADEGVRGIVVQMNMQHYTLEEQADGTAIVTAEAGVRWSHLLEELIPLGWAGLEFGVDIPGTLGAGIVSNVGAHNLDLGRMLEWIEVLDARGCNREEDGQFTQPMQRRYLHDELDLGYRHSRLRAERYTRIDERGQLVFPTRGLIEPAEIVVLLGLRLHRQSTAQLATLRDHYRQDRQRTEPTLPRTGPIFKDPPESTAHALISQTGLAGKTFGPVQIAERNANYVVNLGGATATQIISVVIEMHQRVLARSGINLALNIDLLGEWPRPRVI
ncbi:MAG: UDP-N-acetylmuramate dehydrogenase [Ktedonobacteraceae bacterium]|nr:UDP-N-acetylmuramate dehydrogenase [Ktedonobacteraceae bacterium]